MSNNPYEAEEQNAARRRYLVETFGEDVLQGLPDDTPPTVTRSAARMAKEPMEAAVRRQQVEDLELVQKVAEEEREDASLAHVLRVMQAGKGEFTRGDLNRAGRAAARRGHTHGPVAERLARMVGPR